MLKAVNNDEVLQIVSEGESTCSLNAEKYKRPWNMS